MASTVLPNGIIIPEKYSRDWYADLYHNWQELDNLLGGGTPKDGTLTIQKNGTTVGTFSANQATNETINITVPDVNDATLTIQKNGTTVDTFTANSSTDKTVNISVPTKTSDLTNDSNFVPSTDLATVATSGNYNDLSNKPTIPTVNDATLTIQKNGTNVQTFTANQSTNATANITVPSKTSDLTNDSGFITEDNTKIPLAGSNAISGSLIPATTDAYDLGGTSYQWNNAYIKNYYYKGVAWGLDKANVWSAHQKIVGSNLRGVVSIYNPAYTKGSASSSTDLSIGSIFMGDGGQTGLANSLSFISTDLAANGAITQLSLSAIENTASSSMRTNVVILYDKNDAENPRKVIIQGSARPHADATYSLGASTSKWKSFNGINPGALSLPGTGVIDVSSNITALDGTTANTFTPQVNGWLLINGTGVANDGYIYVTQGRIGMMSANNTAMLRCAVLIPVVAGVKVSVTCKLNTLTWANIATCQGNV